jgi:hypothetical protein
MNQVGVAFFTETGVKLKWLGGKMFNLLVGLAAIISAVGFLLAGLGVLFWGLKLLCKKKE